MQNIRLLMMVREDEMFYTAQVQFLMYIAVVSAELYCLQDQVSHEGI